MVGVLVGMCSPQYSSEAVVVLALTTPPPVAETVAVTEDPGQVN